jgi:hypothetical protein
LTTFFHLGLTAHAALLDNTVSKMEKKVPGGPEWVPFWTTILDLYVAQDMSLSKVKTAMGTRGFSKT